MRRAVRQDLDARAIVPRLPVREVDAYPELIRNVTTDRDRHRSPERKKIVSPVTPKMASTSPAARLWEYVLPDGTVMYGFTPHRVVMPWEAVKQEEPAATHDTPEGTSRDEREATPAARLWEYELPNGITMYGFTPQRVVMPWEFAPVKQEEQGLADLDTPARPFASPPFIRSWTDVLRAARAGCRMRPRARCAFVPSACPLGAGESSTRQEA